MTTTKASGSNTAISGICTSADSASPPEQSPQRLMTPKTGKQMRRELKRKAGDLRERVEDWSEQAGDWVEKGSDLAGKAGDWAASAKNRVEPLAKKFRR